jgi:NTE family protein
MLFPNLRKPRIGLVLDGGGARGAYQIGVYLALKKYKLTNKIVAVSGGSVGAFMSVLYLLDDPEKIINIWNQMTKSIVLSYKKGRLGDLLLRGGGYYSRDGLINFIKNNVPLEQLLKDSKYPVYASLAKMVKSSNETEYVPEYVKLNQLPYDDILTVLLASSAIPKVFDPVTYKNGTYVDCLKADNEPSLPINGIPMDMLFIVPLTDAHFNKSYEGSNITIVDFASKEMMDMKLLNMLEFSEENTAKYISIGYQTANLLLSNMLLHKKLHMETRKEHMCPAKGYFSINSLGIEDIKFAKMDIATIMNDISKGVRK